MIKINGGKPTATLLCVTAFSKSDDTNQYMVMEIKSVRKNAFTASVFSMSSHYHWTKFEHDCCRIALAVQEITNGPCSDWKDI